MKKILISLVLLAGLVSCNETKKDVQLLNEADFKTEVNGTQVGLYTLKAGDITAQVTNFGGRLVSLWAPDKDGNMADVAIGFGNIDAYVNPQGERFIGPIVGRFANRIAKGQFELDGVKYQLPINNNGQTLHGGLIGLDMVAWKVDKVTDTQLDLSYTSPDGTDGFPGNLTLHVTFSVTSGNELKIEYKATTDKPTVINLSHHGFYNLKGEAGGTITDHIMTINANEIVPVNDVLIPTGEIMPVEGTPFDFRQETAIGERIGVENEQLKNGGGYDHNWVLDRKSDKDVELAATVYEPASGRTMEVWTDQPGMQFYSGNFFDGGINGKFGKPIKYREAIALETQHFPDSPNQPNFPNTRLNPGETYTQTCIYKFGIKK